MKFLFCMFLDKALEIFINENIFSWLMIAFTMHFVERNASRSRPFFYFFSDDLVQIRYAPEIHATVCFPRADAPSVTWKCERQRAKSFPSKRTEITCYFAHIKSIRLVFATVLHSISFKSLALSSPILHNSRKVKKKSHKILIRLCMEEAEKHKKIFVEICRWVIGISLLFRMIAFFCYCIDFWISAKSELCI